jgi:hypothetical protein
MTDNDVIKDTMREIEEKIFNGPKSGPQYGTSNVNPANKATNNNNRVIEAILFSESLK